MNTSAISSPVNINVGSPSATKPSDAGTDTSFGQVLSREMTARPESTEPVKATAGAASKNTQAARPANNKSDAAKSAEDSPTNSADASGTSAVTDGKDMTESATSASQDDDAPLSAASEDLLALVASLTQAAAAEAKPGNGIMPVADQSIAGEGVAQAELNPGNAGLPAATDQDLTPHLAAQAAASTPAAILATQQPAANDSAVDTALANAGQAGLGRATTAPEITPRAAALQRANNRTEQAAAASLTTQEQGNFDAKLAQAESGRPAPEIAPQKIASEMAMPKTLQDSQQSIASTFNVGTASPTPLQSTQSLSTPATATHTLAPQVGSPGWDQALGQRVVWMVNGEQQSASLTLNPPDLGPLQVELKVANSQATANFTAAQPEVRQALEAAMPKLREMLGEAGIQLGQASVSAGTPNNQQGGFEQPQQTSRNAGAMDNGADTPAQIVRSQPISAGQGLVDTFA